MARVHSVEFWQQRFALFTAVFEGTVSRPIVMVGAPPYDEDANRWNRLLDF